MNEKTVRITKELEWKALRERFTIGNVTIEVTDPKTKKLHKVSGAVNQLQDAINDGTLDAMIKTCADIMHSGDVYAVYLAMSRNLSSKNYHLNESVYVTGKEIEEKRYDILSSFITTRMQAHKAAQADSNPSNRSYWQWTMEEISKVDVSNYKLVCSIYNNMASAKSKYPQKVVTDPTFAARWSKVSEMKVAAGKLAKASATVTNASDLLAKLDKGDVFTPEEAARLATILRNLK